MNRNIEVINDNLYAVNFNYIKAGYIGELTDYNIADSDNMVLTKEGKIIINSKFDYYQDVIKYFKIIMDLPNTKLGTLEGFYCFIRRLLPKSKGLSDKEMAAFIKKVRMDKINIMFNNLSGVELARRKILNQNIKKH